VTDVALAFDLGGTELRAAIVSRAGEILSFLSVPTMAKEGPAAVLGQMERLAVEILQQTPGRRPIGIGVGAPGPLDPLSGIVIAPPTLTGWHEVPLLELLSARLGLPAKLENDANAAAIGEWRHGAGRGATSVAFVTVSTGIGGGIIADGRILHGRRGLAGEIGHMTITNQGERCFCGAIGCFEAVASGTALGKRATVGTRPFDGSKLRALSADGDVSGRHVVEAARAGDPQALELMSVEAHWLGVGFTNLLHLYSPDVIVMGGGISHGFDLLESAIRATVEERAMSAYRSVPIVAAELGRHAGLVGAASLILHGDGGPALAPDPSRNSGAESPADLKEARHG